MVSLVLAGAAAAAVATPPGLPAPQDVSSLFEKDRHVVESKIAVDKSPLDIAMAHDGSTIWITEHTAGLIAEIAHNKVQRTAAIGKGPDGIALSKDGHVLYVAIGYENALAVVDADSLEVKKKIAVGAFPIGVRVSPDGRFAAVACEGDGSLWIVDTGTLATRTVQVGSMPYYVAIDARSSTVFTGDFGSSTVSVVDVATASRIATIPVGTNPVGIALSFDGRTLFTANWGNSTVSEISVKTREVVKTHAVGTQPYWIAMSPDSESILVSNFGSNVLDVIHGDGRRGRIQVDDAIINVYVSPDGKKIFTTNWAHDAVAVIE